MFHTKNLPWFLTHFPAVIMLVMLAFKPSLWKPFTSYTGFAAAGFLAFTLLLGALKKMVKWQWLLKFSRYRRQLGVASFSYACIHLLCFIIKRGSLKATIPYLFHTSLISTFWIALPILFVLAITSNKTSVDLLTPSLWKRLHKQVYLAEVAVIIHMMLLGQGEWVLWIFGPVILAQFLFYKITWL